jgi:hypothetical protein
MQKCRRLCAPVIVVVHCASPTRRCGRARLSPRAAASTAAPTATFISGGASPSRSLSEGPKSRFASIPTALHGRGDHLPACGRSRSVVAHPDARVPPVVRVPDRVVTSPSTSRAGIGRRCPTLLAQVYGGQRPPDLPGGFVQKRQKRRRHEGRDPALGSKGVDHE